MKLSNVYKKYNTVFESIGERINNSSDEDIMRGSDIRKNLFDLACDYIKEHGKLEYEDDSWGQFEYEIYVNDYKNLDISKSVVFYPMFNRTTPVRGLRMKSSAPYRLRLVIKGVSKKIDCITEPDKEYCEQNNIAQDDWCEDDSIDFEKDLTTQEQLTILKHIGCI